MAIDPKYLKASDGTGAAVLSHVTVARLVNATTIKVDNVDNWPPFFIATYGTLNANGYIVEASKKEFRGRIQSGDMIIEGFQPGFTDNGNSENDVVILKQTTSWADAVADLLRINTPTGLVSPFAGLTAPEGWLFCDGAAVSRTDYAALFAVVGVTYGAGDGATTFNLPDTRSRSVIGAGTAPIKVAKFASRAGNVITVTGLRATNDDEFQTGRAVVFNGTMGGLVNGNTYYIRRVSANSFSLSTTRENAVDNTLITISNDGSGDRTFTLSLTARAVGETGGEERHSLLATEQARHIHSWNTTSSVVMNSLTNPGVAQYNGGNGQLGVTTMQPSGGSNADHNVMSPFLAANFIIRT